MDGSANRPRRSRAWVWWTAGAVLLVVVLALVVPVVSVLQPDYYRRYPGLAARMDHWATSTHSKVSCVECHVEPGVGGFLSFAARAVPAFYSQLLTGPNSTNLLKPPSRDACQKCHTIYRSVAPSGDLLIPHRAHVKVLGMQCVTCHKNLVHSPNRRGFNRPEMETCLTLCHNGDRATNVCSKCHTRKQVPASHKTKDWLQVHGEVARTDTAECAACHDWTPNYCAECHSHRPPSHTRDWAGKGHVPHAKKRGKSCLVCHKQAFCDECHDKL